MRQWLQHKFEKLGERYTGNNPAVTEDDLAVRLFVGSFALDHANMPEISGDECILTWPETATTTSGYLERLLADEQQEAGLSDTQVLVKEFLLYLKAGYPLEVSDEAFKFAGLLMQTETPSSHPEHMRRTIEPTVADGLSESQLEMVAVAIETISTLVNQDTPRFHAAPLEAGQSTDILTG